MASTPPITGDISADEFLDAVDEHVQRQLAALIAALGPLFQIAEVGGDAGDAQHARLLVADGQRLLGVDLLLLTQELNDGRVDGTVRVPMGRPSSGVKPMEVSTLLPPSTAVMDEPLPRWQVMILVCSMGLPSISAACWATYLWLVPWNP